MMCIECGGAVKGSAEVCDSCNGVGVDSHSHVAMLTAGPSMSCSVCGLLVDTRRTQARMCTACNKYVHTSCDSSEGGLDGFTCMMCRRSPLVSDVMLSGMSNPSPGHDEPNTNTNTATSSLADSTNMAPPTSYPSVNSPQLPSGGVASAVGAEFNDVYQLSEGIASPATTSDHSRNSPGFYPENSSSDIDEDFIPSTSRGGYGRGRGAKKKPGPRAGSSSKRGSSKPPSIFPGDKTGLIPGTRGKRGGRGSRGGQTQANKGTRGRGRGRGSVNYAAAIAQSQHNARMLLNGFFGTGYQNQFQNISQSNVREVDEAMVQEGEEERHSKLDDAEYVRTVVLCEQEDEFMQKACLCLVCGSVGKGAESSMVACSNCAQTYHTYCVGLHEKLNNAVVFRGWRCLDCTVCEGCGKGEDESKLLLCEECDVSYHIYCLTPRLDRIPPGPWRCQWCARCRRCNVRVASGLDLTKDGLCLACHSMRKCPKCLKAYNVGDKIIRCSSCMKWYHGTCEDLYNDEMLESAAQNRMRCTACRPSNRSFANFLPFGADNSNVVVCDNVALNKSAEEILGSKFMPSLIRPNPLESMYGYHRSDSYDHFGPIDEEYNADEFEPMMTSGRGRGGGRGGGPSRRLTKIGVGGFVVKQARSRLLQPEEDATSGCSQGPGPLLNGPSTGPDDEGKKQRKPRKPRKSFLEDAYPAIIQENFFGIKAVEGKNLIEVNMDEPSLMEQTMGRNGHYDGHTGHELSHEATEILRNDMTENDILEQMDLRNLDVDVDNMDFSCFMDDEEDDVFEDPLVGLNDAMDVVNKDMGYPNQQQHHPLGHGPSTSAMPNGPMHGQPQHPMPNANHHPYINGPNMNVPPQQQQQQMTQQQIMQQQQQRQMSMYGQQSMGGAMHPGMGQSQPQSNADPAIPNVPTLNRTISTISEQGSDRGGGGDNKADNTARWLEDEPLEINATIAAVLYVNTEHPYLKSSYPDDNERVKQMQKLWRQLAPDRRQQYVTKARQNRTDRGRPRARRVGIAARASSQSSSVDSPTVSSPTSSLFSQQGMRPGMISPVDGMPDRFKVPPIPPGQMQQMPTGLYLATQGQGPPKSEANGMQSILEQSQIQRSCSHLPENVYEEYKQMVEKTKELVRRQEITEGELARLRKQKKTLAAKKRHMQKQQAAAVAAAGEGMGMEPNQMPPAPESLSTPAGEFDLSEEEKQAMTALQTQITGRQKDLEAVKRELKNHQSSMFDFEQQWRIIQPMPGSGGLAGNGLAPVGPLHGPGTTPVGVALRGAIGSGGASALMSATANGGHGTLGPPSYGALMHPPGAQSMRVPQQMPYGSMMNSLEPQRRLPGAYGGFSTTTNSHANRMPWNMMKPPPAPTLGGIPYEHLSPKEKEIYEVLDDVINQITLQIDGRDPAREMMPYQMPPQSTPPQSSNMLKRLLDTSNQGPQGSIQLPSHMMSSQLMDPMEPKPKKKRQMQKKPGPSAIENQYDIMVERVSAQLKNCERLPKRAHEPAPRNPGAQFASMGISDLTNRAEKKALEGDTLGLMHLTFTDDYFTSEERRIGTKSLYVPIPSMADVSPETNLVRLTQTEMPPESEIFTDKEDAVWQPFDVLSSFADYIERCKKSEHIRVRCRITECPPPPEPHRRVFYQKVEEPDDVVVSMLVQENGERGVEATIEDLKKILDINSIDYQLDTPPLSPPDSKNTPEHESTTGQTDFNERIEVEQSQQSQQTVVKEEPVAGPSNEPEHCKMCNQSMNKPYAVQKAVLMGIKESNADSKDALVSFCSSKCYYQMMAHNKVILSTDQLTAAEGQADEETIEKLKQIHAENLAKCINQGKSRMDMPLTPLFSDLVSPRDSRYGLLDESKRDNIKTIRVCELSQLQGEQQRRSGSRAAGEEWKIYSKEILASFLRIHAIKKELALSAKLGVALPIPTIVDRRRCVLCGGTGDGESSVTGRLLNYDIYWVHVNCAVWSSEVFENKEGGLEHVEMAVVRSTRTACDACHRLGATLKCYKVNCEMNFHIPCAKSIPGAKFIRDRTFFCPKHMDVNPECVVTNLEALRRIYIIKNENALLAKLFELNENVHKNMYCLKLGALTFHQVGQLLPEQLKTFHNTNYLFPVGYTVTRWFWSPCDAKVRVQFNCKIQDGNGRPKFAITMGDNHTWEGESATDAWKPILESVEKKRGEVSDALHFFSQAVQGETLFGLNESAISKITESLPGVDTVFTYTFRHSNSPILDLPLAENPSGCARAEPRFRTLIKKRRAIAMQPTTSRAAASISGETTSGRPSRASRGSSSTLEELALKNYFGSGNSGNVSTSELAALIGGRLEPIANNSQSFSQYQKMRKDVGQTVYLARSKIAGMGLYAKRDINMGDMIIEYLGDLIRSEVCEMREKRYIAQNRGVYMFRVDDELVVDATMAGGLARYINHSCDPNCSTKILQLGSNPEDKKIIITANRPIKAYEELTYDYQFPLEDMTDKVPCLCGAPNCHKWMN